MCMGRDHRTGLPNKLMPCPLGARNTSDTCKKARCEYVFIPTRHKYKTPGDDYSVPAIWTKFMLVILVLMFLKFIVFFCGGCCTLFLPY